MVREQWRALRERDPPLAAKILSLGTRVYELGAANARGSPELEELVALLKGASQESRDDLGLSGEEPTETQILTAIFDLGSSLLLDYVRHGSCG